MTRLARVRIDCGALRHNFARVRSLAPRSRVLAVVKGDGYGHGAVCVARTLDGADGFAVARLNEALELRDAGVEQRVLLLSGVFDSASLTAAAKARIELVVHDEEQVALIERARVERRLGVWMKLDTGMRRLGFEPDQAVAVVKRLQACDAVGEVPVVMTHFACADDTDDGTTAEQTMRFEAATDALLDAGLRVERSLANSAGVIAWPAAHADWVRPGIMLYGATPMLGRNADQDGLRPAMTLETQLIAVRPARKGDCVGYGATYECRHDTIIGTAAIGYADGYPRHAPNGTPVLVNGQRGELAGRVSMDMIGIDLGADSTAKAGDPVTLWGEGLPVEEVARTAGTIAYDLTCSVMPRVHRTVVDEEPQGRAPIPGSERVG